MMRAFVGDWRRLALRGTAALLFGLATLVWPEITLWALVILFGAFVLVDGLLGLTAVIAGDVERHRGWWALCALAGVAAGVVTLAWPSITGLILLFVIALWAFVSGAAQLVLAIRLRQEIEHEWLLGLVGALSIAFAVFIVVTPGGGALVITWAIGWYFVLLGILLLLLAWEARHEGLPHVTTVQPRTPHPAT